MLQALSRWKTTILIVSAVLAVGLFASRHLVGPFSVGSTSVGPMAPMAPDTAGNHVGQRAEVCGRVAEVVHAREIGGKPTFINLADTHPDQPFTALIWKKDRTKWDRPPEAQYENRAVCVTGTIRRHEKTPQIVVSSPTQIRLRQSSGD